LPGSVLVSKDDEYDTDDSRNQKTRVFENAELEGGRESND
jgi:hypothetical protein